MKIVIGNWKMNGTPKMLDEMVAAVSKLKTNDNVGLCVPYTMLGAKSKNMAIGAQDVSKYESGAYTGQVSASMLADVGTEFVLVGHSECRKYNGDTNADVRAKASLAMRAGLLPIICVGESESEHKSGKTLNVIGKQLCECVPDELKHIFIAYEPLWAIGTGKTPTDSEISKIHQYIYDYLSKNMGTTDIHILYGGGVNTSNVSGIIAIKHVDGVLIGGASLKKQDFITIINKVIK